MSSRSRNFILLIGAARAVPYPVSSNPAHDTSEPHLQDSAAHEDVAGSVHLQVVALPPSSTADLANLVTPVTLTPSSSRYELTEITPVPAPAPSTSFELTEITPVSVHASSHGTTFTTSSVSPVPSTESETPAQPLLTSPSISISATGQHIGTVTITNWVTVTMPAGGPGPDETQMPESETVPITVIPVTYNNSGSRMPELPGGYLGGPPGPPRANNDDLGETQRKE